MTGQPPDRSLKERLWSLDFLMALAVLHFMYAAFSAQFTVLPEYVEHRGGSEWHLGIVIGSFNFATLLLRPYMGRWVATAGPRKAGIVAGAAFAAAILLYAPVSDVWLMIPVRMLNGVSMSLGTLGAFTAVANLAPPSRRGEGMAWQNISVNGASIWAPYVGFFLLGWGGYTWTFAALAAFALAAGACATAIRSGGMRPEEAGSQDNGEKIPLISKPALFPTFILLTHTVTLAPLITFLPSFADERGLGNPGLFWTLYSGVSLAVLFVSGPMSDRLGRGPVIVPGLAFASAAMFALLGTESRPVFMVLAAVYGAGFALFNPALQAFMFDRVPARERSAAVATNAYAWEIGQSGGALALGPVAGLWGVASTFAVAGAVNAGGLVSFIAHRALAPSRPSRAD